MKKRELLAGAVIVAMELLGAKNVYGFGIGGYKMSASGSADSSPEGIFSSNTKESGTAFVFDSNLSKNKDINWRLGVELAKKIEYGKFSMVNPTIVGDLGYRIFSNDAVRVWVGPEVAVSYQDGYENTDNYWYGKGVGVGAVVGFNINLGDVVSFIVNGGVRRSVYWIDKKASASSYRISHSSNYVNVGLMFRFRERGR